VDDFHAAIVVFFLLANGSWSELQPCALAGKGAIRFNKLEELEGNLRGRPEGAIYAAVAHAHALPQHQRLGCQFHGVPYSLPGFFR
jgi:hypothetical protein